MRHLLLLAAVGLCMTVSGFAQDARPTAHPVIVKTIILKNQTDSLGTALPVVFFTPDHVGVYRVTCGIQPVGQSRNVDSVGIEVYQTASVVTRTYIPLGSYQPPNQGEEENWAGGSFSLLGSPETTFTFQTYTPTSGPPLRPVHRCGRAVVQTGASPVRIPANLVRVAAEVEPDGAMRRRGRR
jgi:hypothetical protein